MTSAVVCTVDGELPISSGSRENRVRTHARGRLAVLAVCAILAATATPAAAQNARTWVSGTGLDTNPCSRTLPCRTFAWALVNTNPGGEIDALDAGDFLPVEITKAVTIDGGSGVAGVTVPVVASAITVNAGANDAVTLRNLSINATAGIDGINVLGGRTILVENCVISGFSTGIRMEPQGAMTATIANTTVRNNGFGIRIAGGVLFYARLTASHVRLVGNNSGMVVTGNSLVFVRDSIASDNVEDGFDVVAFEGRAAELDLENASSSNNGNAGVLSLNAGALVRLSHSSIDHNVGAGVLPLFGGQTLTYGNNTFAGNGGGDGTITGGGTVR
jgi:hypothetical protein